ncbi:hypothetical protein TNIN_474751 [Trichonephila inaurata madagascariensis]|uniref:Uncharacterized protein n=1 Tax=Trichonephila inaurata madagascariensis TaxID=2747483 RepID=A0A8X6XPB0_9ARAC|nr:hypothetical protein TNIN_474751 [Trichonephila inaurata madagascariensis]
MDSILSSKESTCPSEILETYISIEFEPYLELGGQDVGRNARCCESSFTELENSEVETNNSLEPDARASSSNCEQETSSRQGNI